MIKSIVFGSIVLLFFSSLTNAIAEEEPSELINNNVKDWHAIAVTLISEGKFEESIRYYDMILDINPDDQRALLNKGSLLLELGKYDESIRNYDMILDINPKNVKALASKSIALSKLERYSEALIAIDTAVMLEPDNEIVQNKKMNFLAGVPTIPAHDSIYDINFRITLRDSSGNFIGVAEATNTRYLPYDITDTALETELSTKERVTIDGMVYDRVQKTEKYVNKNTEMNGMWSFTVRDQGFIIDVFQAFTPYVTLEDGDNIVAEWIILKQIS